MSAYFVTATGTDIGKTYVTAGLVRHLRGRGTPVRALKPVISGFDPASAATSDTGVLLTAMGEAVSPQTIERISPWRFAPPLSPDMAAAQEGRSIDFDALVAFCREAGAAQNGTLFIEGVGGVMVPLDGHHTVLDWMAALGLPAILVAGSYLGTLSHTLTAAGALAHAGIRIASVVVNESASSPVSLPRTMVSMERFLPDVPVGLLRRNAHKAEFAWLFKGVEPDLPL